MLIARQIFDPVPLLIRAKFGMREWTHNVLNIFPYPTVFERLDGEVVNTNPTVQSVTVKRKKTIEAKNVLPNKPHAGRRKGRKMRFCPW